tara:strand:+ start:535 stop:1050 length:516 start_codon:yes stop_codon:yes gene_type:complete
MKIKNVLSLEKNLNMTLICSYCKIEKPHTAFGKSTHGRLHKNNIRYKYICRGCDYKIIKKRHIEQPHIRLFHLAKRRASDKNIEFLLTKDLIKLKFPKDNKCPVTRKEFKYDIKDKNQNPTIDRIDNSKGYTPENIVIVSYIVNKIKNDLQDFTIFKQIIDFYTNKNLSIV